MGSMYITVSWYNIGIQSKHLLTSERGGRNWRQSCNQAVEPSTQRKLLRFPVEDKQQVEDFAQTFLKKLAAVFILVHR